MLNRISLSLCISLATAIPARAEFLLPTIGFESGLTVIVFPDGSYIWFRTLRVLIAVVIGIVVAVCLSSELFSFASSSSCDTSESALERAQRHDQEAARLRAASRQTEAHTELTARLIDKARVDAEYGELKQITDHDRKIRNIHRSGR
ncbi:MAG: hypothetical protein QOI05_360 [Bradyrhizobium sp.]|nr:hypothetical protein [Bradyrhizobium sp.]